MTIRAAGPSDAELLAEHRAAVWHEVGAASREDLILQRPIWATFFRDRLRDATYAAFVAEEAGAPVGSGGILIHTAIPRPYAFSDRAGRVLSLYVEPARRRRGIARTIVGRLIAYAREARLVSLTLHPTDDARPLYRSVGFEAADEMVLRLAPADAPYRA